ncbi:MAG: SHOCT domain-containing protein [Clostridiales bacterium]|nr:SHOCT domain-containing protein [Clostridiales bacterium]
MDINSLTSAARETIIYESLMVLRKNIPNVTRTSGILINQTQPVSIEEKKGFYSVTAYVRAVDFSGKYIFLGPYYLKATPTDDGGYKVDQPRFDCGVDGCYYDVVGKNSSHLKIYDHMASIDETAVYFENCESVAYRDAEEGQDGVVRFDLHDGSFKVFTWDLSTQNTEFMYNLMCVLEDKIKRANKPAPEPSPSERRRMMAAGASSGAPSNAAPAEKAEPVDPNAGLKPNSPFRKTPASGKSPFSKPAQPSETPAANSGRPGLADAEFTPFQPPAAERSPFAKPNESAKPAFVPLKGAENEQGGLSQPQYEGPAIAAGPIIEPTVRMGKIEDEIPDGAPKPMTAESLAHLDDWKPYKSRVVTTPEIEIEKYKKLVAIGAMTQDEFEVKKRQLLGYPNQE